MAKVKLKWFGGAISRLIGKEMGQRLFKAGTIYSRFAKQKMIARVNRDGKNPSRPGEFPKVASSNLVKNITFEVDPGGKSGRWGTNVKYGRWLETGTRLMRPRPWMSLTNAAKRTQVRQMLERPMRGLR